MEESSIIRRAQTGDQRAFQQLFETYHALVWRTARAWPSEATATEEVARIANVSIRPPVSSLAAHCRGQP